MRLSCMKGSFLQYCSPCRGTLSLKLQQTWVASPTMPHTQLLSTGKANSMDWLGLGILRGQDRPRGLRHLAMDSSFLDFRIFRMSLIHTWPEKSSILHISIDRRVQSKDIHLETSIASGRSQSSAPHLRFEVPGPLIFLGQSCKWH